MRIGYFGNPGISAMLLQRLLNWDEAEIVFVVTNPASAIGRSKKLIPSAVASLIKESPKDSTNNLVILFEPHNIEEASFHKQLEQCDVDIFLVFSYGKILSSEILSIPKKAAINLHGSLLPKLRGASPIQNSILSGMQKTGWTIQHMTSELDAGDIIAQKEMDIHPEQSYGELTSSILPAGIDLVLTSLLSIEKGTAKRQLQKHEDATYCKKIQKKDSEINWSVTTRDIHNHILGYNPWPLAWTILEGKKLQIYRIIIIANDATEASKLWANWQMEEFGTLKKTEDAKALWVKTGDGIISILELQLENKRQMHVKEFLNGYRHKEKTVLSKLIR